MRRTDKPDSRFKKPTLLDVVRQSLALLVAGSFLSQQTLQAATPPVTMPTGGAYTAGAGSIKTSGNAVTINQSTLRGIIDWNTFSIGQGGTVNFFNGSGATLNRVNGSQMSSILGSLIASGSVYLINPQGVLIGPGARVRTGGDFVASTLKLSPDAFMNGGSMLFKGESKNVVVNLGDIFSKDGSIFLVGHEVKNAGRVDAAHGTAGLASGSEVLLKDSTGDERVFVKGPGGDLTNTGAITAAQAELKTKGGNIYALAGNNGGTIAATGTAKINGRAWLIADGGKTQVTGTVSAQNADGQGGNIETSGHDLDISHAVVKTGQGGNWLLDPVDVEIGSAAAATIENSLATTNVTVETTATGASGPGTQSPGDGDINVNSDINWASNNSLTLSAYHNIHINDLKTIANTGGGSLTLRADNTANGTGMVSFGDGAKLDWSQSTGIVSVLYNPVDETHRYDSPLDFSPVFFSNPSWVAPANHTVSNQMTAYMLVNNATDLEAVRNSGTYALGKDLNVSSNSSCIELGRFAPGFTGIFDGFGHTIDGLTMLVNDSPLGFFQFVGQEGIIRNLNLTNINVQNTVGDPGEFGGLVGNNAGTIANVAISGTVKNLNRPDQTGGVVGHNMLTGLIYNVQSAVAVDESQSLAPTGLSAIGGIVGRNEGFIVNSTVSGAVISNGLAHVGGMAGLNTGTITNSSASGAVSDSGESGTEIGGLIGTNSGTLTGVSASGNVSATGTGQNRVGGLIGWNSAPLNGLNATGNVSGTSTGTEIGGLVGHQEGSIDNSTAHGTVTAGDSATAGGLAGVIYGPVTNSSATGNVSSGDNSMTGGLTGWSFFNTISGSSASGNVTAGNSGVAGGLTGRIDGAVNNSFATGAVNVGDNLNVGGLVGTTNSPITNSYATGAVTAGYNGYVGGLVGYTPAAITDSHAGGSVTNNGSMGNSSFVGGLAGIVDSAGSVSNSYASGNVSAGGFVGGLVGQLSGSLAADSNATGTVSGGDGSYVGGLVGHADSPLSGFTVIANVQGGLSSAVGGLVGLTSSSIANSSVSGTVTGGNGSVVGGLAGNVSLTITNSSSSAAITGGSYSTAGGLVGMVDGTVSGSSATGNVSGGYMTGGLAGSAQDVDASGASGNVSSPTGGVVGGLVGMLQGSLTNSHATGTVTAGDADYYCEGPCGMIGGLAGSSRGSSNTISNSYATGNVSAGINNQVGGLVGSAGAAVIGSHAVGAVNAGDNSNIGGLVGRTGNSITNSYATGAVSGGINDSLGGLVGYTNAAISGSHAIGNINGGGSNNGQSHTGGLAGTVDSAGSVSNSYASGSITTTGHDGAVGGLIGTLRGTVTTDSTSTGAVSGADYSWTGGLIGESDTPLSGFTFAANVQAGTGATVGGLVGHTTSTVADSSVSGTVAGGEGATVGGLAGYVGQTVTNSSSSAVVTGGVNSTAGGLVGTADENISDSSATGNVTGGLTGGLVGVAQNGTISGSSATGNVTGSFAAGGLAGVAGAVDNSSASGAVNANADGAGGIAGGLVGMLGASVTNSHAAGTVTAGDAPTSCQGPCGTVGGLVGVAFGSDSNSSISNSYATGNVSGGANTAVGGLVGQSSVHITNSYANGSVTAGNETYAGGLVGNSFSTIGHSYATGSVTAGDDTYAGGLAGSSGDTIDHSYATGNVTAGTSPTANSDCTYCAAVGGLVGYSYAAPISASFATGTVSVQGFGAWVGGLVGQADAGGDVQQSFATGNVSVNGQNSIAGGLVGDTLALVADSYSLGSVSAVGTGSIAGGLVGRLDTGTSDNPGLPVLNSSYSTGAVSGADTLGGLIGHNMGTENITAGYWDMTTSGQAASDGGTGLTTKQWLAQGPVATGDAAWNFSDTWVQGYPYPVLKVFPYVVASLAPSGHRTYGGADPTVTMTSAVDQNGNDAANLIQGTFAPVMPVLNANVGVNNLGGSGQFVPGSQLTYMGAMNIDQATLTFTGLLANNKVYDGTAAAILSLGSLGISGLLAGDAVTVDTSAVSASFTDKNAGTNKTVNVSGLTLSGAAAGNYTIAPVQQTTASISPAALIQAFTANNKVYDGTTAAAVTAAPLSGVIGTDAVSLTGAAYNFSDKNAGTGKAVSGTQAALSGADAGNYVVQFVQNGTADITPAPLTLAGVITGVNKTYDGTTAATVTGASLSGVVPGDVVNLVQSASFADKNAGRGKTVTYTNTINGADTANYTLASPVSGTAAADINPATLLEIFTANNKVYDGTTTATVTATPLGGVIGTDAVSLTGAAYSFSDKNAGTGKSVSGTQAALSGADAGNYVVNFVQNGTADISPATLTAAFTANNKVYDGTTTATATLGALSGVIAGDSVSVGGGAFQFGDKNAGTGKTITGSHGVLSGADAGNYVVQFVQNGTADITPATLFYTASSAVASRPYGVDNPALSGTVTGLVGGDTLASVAAGSPLFTASATAQSSVGTYAVAGSGLTLTSGNYTLAQAPGNASAFTVNPITIRIGNAIKLAGTPNPTFTVHYSGPSSDYLQTLLSSLKLVTDAPASGTPGTYHITAVVPSELAGSLLVQPGTLTITANANVLINNGTPQVVATIPAALNTQTPAPPMPLPSVNGGASVADQLMPGNAVSHFQVVIQPSAVTGFQNSTTTADALSQASFSETSPDGRTKNNKSTYAAGAQK